MLATNETEAPGPLRSLDASEFPWLTVGNTTVLGIVVAVGCLAVGLAAFLGFLPRLFLSLGAVMALAGWVAMEAAGERQERAAARWSPPGPARRSAWARCTASSPARTAPAAPRCCT
jgi:hypothetical protein